MKWKKEGKKVEKQLSEVTTEAVSLQDHRDALALERRKIERSEFELKTKLKNIHRQIREKENEKKCLETTRENCIAL